MSTTVPAPGPVLRPRAVLIGPMAAGKTSVGRALARRWSVPFADLDAEIVRREGRGIPEIFAERGEPAFRELEAALLAEMLVSHAGVLSLGGGAPLQPSAAGALAGHRVVLLEIDEDSAAARLRGGEGRPVLAGGDPIARWREITAARLPAYRSLARVRIDAGGGGPAEVAERVEQALDLDLDPTPEEDA